MSEPGPFADEVLALGPRIRVLPVVHGSGDCAIRVREELLSAPYDCVAIPLPRSFREEVETAVERLPDIAAVLQRDADGAGFSYVPIDPCQPVIAAIRTARGERIARAYIDRETGHFEPQTAVFPDPYALKRVRVEAFAAAVLPSIPPPAPGQHVDRIATMAANLRRLETRHERILCVASLRDWPWLREAYRSRAEAPEPEEPEAAPWIAGVAPKTLIFFLGELPYVTGLYERGRRELTLDDNLSVDGVKELVLAARDRLRTQQSKVADRLTPALLSLYLKYVRNLCLVERRLTPDLYTLVVAAQQIAGDGFALAVAETAREYPYAGTSDTDQLPPPDVSLRMGLGEADVPGFGPASMTSRLPGPPVSWRTLRLKVPAPESERRRWKQRWNPHGLCSWPPEDDRIESFHHHVRDQARATLGADLARSEKFSTSLKDGLDLRETLRHWHTGELYVKVIPPDRGSIDAVLFLFDVPADPRRYVHRTTWYAEHPGESTLAFFATDPMQDLVGPGIARAEYGGALFLYPPRFIPDVWTDPRLDRLADTLELRLLAAGLVHSRERQVAVVSPKAPPASWRRLARRLGRRIVHLPLKRFSGATIERIRTFHVLNGKTVRSYASEFIRDF